MSKNILILSGSPRKGGNSDILCDRFMEGARESGHRAEKVFLRDRNIGYCIGCEACHQNNGVCVQKDDMAEILGKMIAADVIVMATPVYFYTMDAQMKTLIDRCVARYTEISTRRFYFIATGRRRRKAVAGEDHRRVPRVPVLSGRRAGKGHRLRIGRMEKRRYQGKPGSE